MKLSVLPFNVCSVCTGRAAIYTTHFANFFRLYLAGLQSYDQDNWSLDDLKDLNIALNEFIKRVDVKKEKVVEVKKGRPSKNG